MPVALGVDAVMDMRGPKAQLIGLNSPAGMFFFVTDIASIPPPTPRGVTPVIIVAAAVDVVPTVVAPAMTEGRRDVDGAT